MSISYHTTAVVEISLADEQTGKGDLLFRTIFYTGLFRVISGNSGHSGRNIDFGLKSVQKKITSLKLIFAVEVP